MSLATRPKEEVKQAMLARDDERRDALRLILNSLRSAEKELQRPLSEGEELQVLQRERKSATRPPRRSATAAGPSQAAKEEAELAILAEFMPEPLSEEELERIVDDAIAETGATSTRHGSCHGGRDAADRRPRGRVGRSSRKRSGGR